MSISTPQHGFITMETPNRKQTQVQASLSYPKLLPLQTTTPRCWQVITICVDGQNITQESKMEPQDNSEVEKIQAEKNQLKKIIEGLNSQFKKSKEELEATRKKLKKAEYERDNAESYVINLKQEVAALNKELYEERQRRKEEQEIKDTESVGFEPSSTVDENHKSSDSLQDETKDLKSVLEEAASAAMTKSGFVYDDRTGLYYDWNSGLYYDPSTCLYYNNKTGTYYYYNEKSGEYEFHSQVELQNEADQATDDQKEKQTVPKYTKQKKTKETTTKRADDEYSSGELTDSDDDDDDDDDDQATTDEDTPPAEPVAPCIRVIVMQSNKLKVGTLFIVPCTGGTLGREKNVGHLIRIPDLELSKHHCKIQYDQERRQYFICDLASRNGSFLNGQRLAESKELSEPHVLTHGDMLSVGGNTMLLHIHPGNETCDDCEPGQVQAQSTTNDDVYITKVVQPAALSAEDSRKKQLKMLKKAYGLEKEAFCESSDVMNKGKYRDRADLRRAKVGSDMPDAPDAAPSSVHRPIKSDNKGRKMLEKMGWKTGEGLGKEGVGRTEPIIASLRESKKGLGGGIKRSLDDVHLSSNNASYLRTKARERYEKIMTSANTDTTSENDQRTVFISQKSSRRREKVNSTVLDGSNNVVVDKDVDMFAD